MQCTSGTAAAAASRHHFFWWHQKRVPASRSGMSQSVTHQCLRAQLSNLSVTGTSAVQSARALSAGCGRRAQRSCRPCMQAGRSDQLVDAVWGIVALPHVSSATMPHTASISLSLLPALQEHGRQERRARQRNCPGSAWSIVYRHIRGYPGGEGMAIAIGDARLAYLCSLTILSRVQPVANCPALCADTEPVMRA